MGAREGQPVRQGKRNVRAFQPHKARQVKRDSCGPSPNQEQYPVGGIF